MCDVISEFLKVDLMRNTVQKKYFQSTAGGIKARKLYYYITLQGYSRYYMVSAHFWSVLIESVSLFKHQFLIASVYPIESHYCHSIKVIEESMKSCNFH